MVSGELPVLGLRGTSGSWFQGNFWFSPPFLPPPLPLIPHACPPPSWPADIQAQAVVTFRSELFAPGKVPFSHCSMALTALPDLRVFGATVFDVLALALPRDLDVVELWAGKKVATFAARKEGLNCQTIEREDGPGQDLTTEEGFWAAARAIMGLRIGGLLIMAPVCSSFVFANSIMTRRTNVTPEGDGTYGPVRDGNFMALVAAFFFIVAFHHGAYVFWENPLNSFIWKQPCVISAWDYVLSCRCYAKT